MPNRISERVRSLLYLTDGKCIFLLCAREYQRRNADLRGSGVCCRKDEPRVNVLISYAAGNVVALSRPWRCSARSPTFSRTSCRLRRTCSGSSAASTFTGRPLLAQTFGAALALAFSIWMIGETGKATVFDGVILIFIGIPVYLADQWRRTRRATVAATPTTSDSV